MANLGRVLDALAAVLQTIIEGEACPDRGLGRDAPTGSLERLLELLALEVKLKLLANPCP